MEVTEPSAGRVRTTVLIVDDSSSARQVVGDALRRAGFSVVEGTSGEDALQRITAHRVQLVLTDFNLPVMCGLDLIKRLRAMPEHRATPILVLTAETEEMRKQESRWAGATGWVTKPFDPNRLIQVVHRLVP